MTKWVTILLAIVLLGVFTPHFQGDANKSSSGQLYTVQWEQDYGTLWWWSARYEGPQPIGDADNDEQNEILVGGRDPFLRVLKWDKDEETYLEQARLIDPVFGIGYSFFIFPQPFGSATGFSIADIDNDGFNEIGVAWGRHFSAFKWDGYRYNLMGRYIISDNRGWQTTLDCIVGDCDNDGDNEIVITGGYQDESTPEVVVISWDGHMFQKESSWNDPWGYSVYFPWIADTNANGRKEIIINTNRTLALEWDVQEQQWSHVVVATHENLGDRYPFGCVAKDSDGDSFPEIHVTFYSPELRVYEWTGAGYQEKWRGEWPGEEGTIEAIDVGDVDDDGCNEICVGTDKVHILEWDGTRYLEDYVITETYGFLAVTAVGDCDSDGKNEIHAGSVGVDPGESYMSWIFKYRR